MSILHSVDSARQTVITSLKAPRAKGVSTSQIFESKGVRDPYEQQLLEETKRTNKSIIKTLYRESIEDDDISIFITSG